MSKVGDVHLSLHVRFRCQGSSVLVAADPFTRCMSFLDHTARTWVIESFWTAEGGLWGNEGSSGAVKDALGDWGSGISGPEERRERVGKTREGQRRCVQRTEWGTTCLTSY